MYGQRLSKDVIRTKPAYIVGKDNSAKTFAQNIVKGGKAPKLRKAKKEEIILDLNHETPKIASR